MEVGKKRKLINIDLYLYQERIQRKYREVNKAITLAFQAIELAKDLAVDLGEDVQDELMVSAEKQLNKSAQNCHHVLEIVEESRLRLNETNILNLPDLALIELLKFLPLRDILSLRTVNSRLYTEVTRLYERCRVWELSEAKVLNKVPDDFFCQSNRGILLNIVSLPLLTQMFNFVETSDCADRIVGVVLGTFDIERLPPHLIQKIRGLHTLEVRSLEYLNGSRLQTLLEGSSNTLKKLILGYTEKGSSLRIRCYLTNLQSLELRDIKDKALIFDVLKKVSPNLKYLAMHFCDLRKLSKFNKALNLRKLEINGCIGSDGFNQFLGKCGSSLEYLRVSGFGFPSPEGHLFSVNCEMTNLERLHYHNFYQEDANGLQNLLSCSPRLEHLYLGNAKFDANKAFQPRLPKLKTLEVVSDYEGFDQIYNVLLAAQHTLQYFELRTIPREGEETNEPDGDSENEEMQDVDQNVNMAREERWEKLFGREWYLSELKKIKVSVHTGDVKREHLDGHVPHTVKIEING